MRRSEMAEDSEDAEKLPEQVDAEEARLLVARGRAKVIDIRSADEFAEERIVGSTHCEADDIRDCFEADHREGALIVCADGARSAEVAEELRGDGADATSLDGGFASWTGDHLPTAPNPDEEYEGPPVKIPGAVNSGDGDDEDGDEESDDARGESADSQRSERAGR